MIADAKNSERESWPVERRSDGALLVRVPSRRDQCPPLPDAVFTFRDGDPQFDFWHGQLAQREAGQQSSN
jgi:hypothetical protein